MSHLIDPSAGSHVRNLLVDTPKAAKTVEFRIPISPTQIFFSQVRFFNFALRRFSDRRYRDARLSITVGDRCDLDAVRRENRWSENFNINWERTPDDVFADFHWAGTAIWRFCTPATADVVVHCDADTVLLRDIDPLVDEFTSYAPTVKGHMAHFPPGLGANPIVPQSHSADFWPALFRIFSLPWPAKTYRYSIDPDLHLPISPPYFNLGFVAMNPKAQDILATEIWATMRSLTDAIGDSYFKCQIALTLAAHQTGCIVDVLPAEYNAANDLTHLNANKLTADKIRVLHFLRNDEIDRRELQPALIDDMLARNLVNPANIVWQDLVREYRNLNRNI
ncbi:hypothetical protein NKI38_06740 [Mesorhizobium sp. M0621]|uniref:hypothetical protein n=1 Tax=Mesorhizobium sp. M0621 TaxID=2956974 RepID=UPI00333C7087